jgi:hypothetical protein
MANIGEWALVFILLQFWFGLRVQLEGLQEWGGLGLVLRGHQREQAGFCSG